MRDIAGEPRSAAMLRAASSEHDKSDGAQHPVKAGRERVIEPDAHTDVEPGGFPVALARLDIVVPDVDDRPTGREVVHAAIARSVAQLLRHLPGARHGEDAEGVHQARVAVRRLRSDLRTFQTIVDASWVERWQPDLRWLGRTLGHVRDDDVLLSTLETMSADTVLVGVIERERAVHRAGLVEDLDSRRAARLLDELVTIARQPPIGPGAGDQAAELMTPTLRKSWSHVRRAVDRLGAEPSDPELHELRILVKRCRYAVEAGSVVFGRPAERSAKRLARLQDVLGDLNDAAVISRRMRYVADREPDAAFAAGTVAGHLTTTALAGRDEWRRAWKKASSKKRWRWL